MGFQPEYGNKLSRTRVAAEELHYYRIIKEGATEGKVAIATEGDTPLAIVTPSNEAFYPGTSTKRDSFLTGEFPDANVDGVAYVELGESVDVDELCVSDNVGRGVAGAEPFTDPDSIRTAIGRFMDSGDEGDKVRVNMNRRT